MDNFVAEIGVGKGAGVTVSILDKETGISAYKDVSWGVKNGETYKSATGNASVQIAGIGPSYQYEHPLPFPEDVAYWANDPYNTQMLLRSPYATTSYGFDIPFTGVSKDGIFIGIELELHTGIGGHIKIGWDIK